MKVDELVGQLRALPDEELAAALDSLTELVERVRRRVEREQLVALAQAAAEELRDEPAMDADDIRAYLGRSL